MTLDDYERFLLALTMWREARGEGIDGMYAVACVVRNRVRAGMGTYWGVLTHPRQFSSMTVRGDSQTVLWPVPSDPRWTAALDWDEVNAPDITHGALYYWNPKTATSRWFRDEIAAKHKRMAVIGNHEFYA